MELLLITSCQHVTSWVSYFHLKGLRIEIDKVARLRTVDCGAQRSFKTLCLAGVIQGFSLDILQLRVTTTLDNYTPLHNTQEQTRQGRIQKKINPIIHGSLPPRRQNHLHRWRQHGRSHHRRPARPRYQEGKHLRLGALGRQPQQVRRHGPARQRLQHRILRRSRRRHPCRQAAGGKGRLPRAGR